MKMATSATLVSPLRLSTPLHRPAGAAASPFLSPAALWRRRNRWPSLVISSPAPRSRRFSLVVAAQSNLFKVIQRTWRVGKDIIDAGSNLVPETVPRPIARIGVAGVAATVALFLLKSFISTAFFVLAMMGAIYFIYIASNKDEGGGGGGGGSTTSEDETLEEARRIMEKYK